MSLPLWPSSLPAPATSYSGEWDPTSIRTRFESGYVRQRRKTTVQRSAFNVSWVLSEFEFEIFRAWHAEKINFGSAQFTIGLAFGGPEGEVLSNVTARIVEGTFRTEYVPVAHWKVSAVLEVFDPPRLPDTLIDLLDDAAFVAGFDDLEAAIAALQVCADSTLPSNLN